MTNQKVFISYSHEDKQAVESLIGALDRHKIEYWSDQKIGAGEQWKKKIESALYSASIYVLFISPKFLESSWTSFEMGVALGRARESGALIVPVLLRPATLPKFIQQFQYIDATSLKPSDFAEKIQQIVENKAA